MPAANTTVPNTSFETSIDLLKRAYQDAPIGLCLLDNELRYLFINDWLAGYNGKTIDQHLGRTIAEVIPDIAERAIPQLRGVLDTGKPVIKGIVEITAPNDPGGIIVFQHDYHAVLEGDKVIGVSCAVQNVTKERLADQLALEIEERIAVEQQLRNNEKQFRDLLEVAPEAMIFTQLDGMIMIANAQASKLFGYARDELIGQSIEVVVPVWHRSINISQQQKFSNNLKNQLMGERRELVGLRKDGVEIPVEISLGLIDRSDGPLVASTIRDISDRKAAAENLRLVRQEASIQQEQLARLIRIQTLGEMASGIAHEINQPLAAIQSYAEATNRYLPPHEPNLEKVSDLLEKINRQALRAGSIVSHLRSLMQQQDVKFEPTDINILIREMTKLAEIDTANHDCRLILKFSSSLPTINCNVIQIQQVVLNLIRNAMEAMIDLNVESEKIITIETKLLDTDHIDISIEDRGPGFDIKDQKVLFDAFFTTKKSGLGMGLAICSSIINTHGGKIEASVGLRGGATFRFSLPVDKPAAQLETES